MAFPNASLLAHPSLLGRMEFVYILKSLWSRRILLAVALVAATAAAILTASQVKSGSVKVGAATTEILIDASDSTLGDLRREVEPLTARGAIFARFLASEEATRAISKESGIPEREIAVAAPQLSVAGVPDAESAKRIAKLDSGRRYLLRVQQGDQLPVLSIFTQAPTEAGARKLANGTAVALAGVVEELQAESGVPEKRQVDIRQLGTARSGVLEEQPSMLLAALAFVAVLLLFCFAILVGPALVAAWRTPVGYETLPVAHDNGFSDTYGFGDPHNGGSSHGRMSPEALPEVFSTAVLTAAPPAIDTTAEEDDDPIDDKTTRPN